MIASKLTKTTKQRALCVIGAADSRKTSLFSTGFQIVPLNRIVRVLLVRSDNLTKIIFVDEVLVGYWTSII